MIASYFVEKAMDAIIDKIKKGLIKIDENMSFDAAYTITLVSYSNVYGKDQIYETMYLDGHDKIKHIKEHFFDGEIYYQTIAELVSYIALQIDSNSESEKVQYIAFNLIQNLSSMEEYRVRIVNYMHHHISEKNLDISIEMSKKVDYIIDLLQQDKNNTVVIQQVNNVENQKNIKKQKEKVEEKENTVKINDNIVYFTDTENAMITEFASKIDLNNSSQVIQYGRSALQKLFDGSKSCRDYLVIDKKRYEKDFHNALYWHDNIISEIERTIKFPYNIMKPKRMRLVENLWFEAASIDSKTYRGGIESIFILIVKNQALCSKYIEKYTNYCKEIQMYYLAGEQKLLASSIENEMFQAKLVNLSELAAKTLWLIEKLHFIEELHMQLASALTIFVGLFDTCFLDSVAKSKNPDDKLPESFERFRDQRLLVEQKLKELDVSINETFSEYALFVASKLG